MSALISLYLPFPPSVNCLYTGKARRRKSDAYKLWQSKAMAALAAQHYNPITSTEPLQLTITLARPDKRQRDEQNYAKATTDFLVARGVIPDDRFIGRTITQWGDKVGVEVDYGVMVEVSML